MRYIEGKYHNYYIEADYNICGPYNYYDGERRYSENMYDIEDLTIKIFDVDGNEVTNLSDAMRTKIENHIEDKILCDLSDY